MNAPQINPPAIFSNPAKRKPWFVANVFARDNATALQDTIRQRMEPMAAEESARMWENMGRYNDADRCRAKLQQRITRPTNERWLAAHRAAKDAKHEETDTIIFEALTRPMTLDDLIQATGFSKSTVRRAVNAYLDEGKTRVTYAKRLQIWERAQ